MNIPSSNILLQLAKPLFGGNIKNEDNLDKLIQLLDNLFAIIDQKLSLDCIDLKQYGLECSEEVGKSILCQLFTVILENETSILQQYDQINKYLETVKQLVSEVQSTKVKVAEESQEAKYLINTLDIPVSHVAYNKSKDQITIKGLLPIGTRMFINPNRLSSFDNTGKGKAGTDLHGWVIRNGQNGTDNALGKYVKTTSVLTDGGKSAGTNEYSLGLNYFKSFTLKVTGNITEALDVIKPYALIRKLGKRFGSGGSRDILIPDNGGTSGDKYHGSSHNLKHGHAFNLKGEHTNENPDKLFIDLEHIKEIPIEFIGF